MYLTLYSHSVRSKPLSLVTQREVERDKIVKEGKDELRNVLDSICESFQAPAEAVGCVEGTAAM